MDEHDETLTVDDPEIETTNVTEVDPTDVTEAKEAPKQLRDALKRTQQELAVAKERERLRSYADIGLDAETGMGKAISTTYKGDGTDLAEYAQTEFGYRFAGVENPLVAEINNAYGRLDAASVGAGSIGAPSRDDLLAEAERRGDHQTTLNIKAQQVAAWFR